MSNEDDAAAKLALFKEEARRIGADIPAHWNETLSTAMLASTSGAIVVWGLVLLRAKGHSDARLVRQGIDDKRHREQVRVLVGLKKAKRPELRLWIRKWNQIARNEGNPRAGADFLASRERIRREDGISGTLDLMDNGDIVLTLVCDDCGTKEVKRWPGIGFTEDMAAGRTRELVIMLSEWHLMPEDEQH